MAKASRHQAEATLKALGETEFRVALDVLEFLRSKKCDAATREILEGPVLARGINVALADFRKGRMPRFTAWERVKQRHR